MGGEKKRKLVVDSQDLLFAGWDRTAVRRSCALGVNLYQLEVAVAVSQSMILSKNKFFSPLFISCVSIGMFIVKRKGNQGMESLFFSLPL